MITWFVYYTDHAHYRDMALRLQEQGKQWRLDIVAQQMPNLGDWMKNCTARSQLLERHVCDNPGKWFGILDSDLDILRDPMLMREQFKGDVMCSYLGPNRPPDRRYIAGIVAFAPTDKGYATLFRWASLCRSKDCPYEIAEQAWLDQAIIECQPIVCELPRSYNRMLMPWNKDDEDKIVVAHRFDPNKPGDVDKRLECKPLLQK
jgi:hypothetical protein